MDPQDAKLLTAVVFPLIAGSASPTSDVRLDRTFVSDLDPTFVRVDPYHGGGELVPNYPGVRIDWMTAGKRMEVTPADAHLFHPEQSFSRG